MKNNQRINITKQDLIDAFWELYKVKGNKQVNITDVVKKAGYNRATFYRYFNNVNDPLIEIENNLFNTISEFFDNEKKYKADLSSIIEDMTKFDQNFSEYLFVICSSNGDNAFALRLIDLCFTKLNSLESFSMFDDNQKKLLISYVIGGVLFVYITTKRKKITSSEKEIFKFAKNLFFNGFNHLIENAKKINK